MYVDFSSLAWWTTRKRFIKDNITILSHLVRGGIIEMIPLKSHIVANLRPARILMDR